MSKNKRLSIIVGHTKASPGANNYKGESEYSFNSRIADKIARHISRINSDIDTRVFFRDGIGRSGVANLVKSWRADLSIELHFNSYKKIAYGIEILVHHREKDSIDAADAITDELAEKFQLKERGDDGVKLLKDGDRGYYNLKLLRSIPISMLIEPCFANIETSESRAIFEDEDKYAAILGNELILALGETLNIRQDADAPGEVDIDLPASNGPELTELKQMRELIAHQQKKLNEQYSKIKHQENILNVQNEAWTDLSDKLTEAVELINEGIQEVIIKSQDVYLKS